MKFFIKLTLAGLLMAPISFSYSFSYAGVGEAAREGVEDTKKAVKKGAHRVEEKACEMVDGKLKCLPKKVKNRVEEVKEEVKDMAN